MLSSHLETIATLGVSTQCGKRISVGFYTEVRYLLRYIQCTYIGIFLI